jgi:shikimate dehydrogenase
MQQYKNIKRLYGLIGYPLSHSFSQKYFRQKFIDESIDDADFLNFEMEDISNLREFLKQYPLLKGFAVTIPHKERIIALLDEIDKDALEMGAVNTVTCNWKGADLYLKGYNTDFYGFQKTLEPFLKGHEKQAIIFGNGGASKAVQFAISRLGISYIIVDIIGSDHKNIILYSELDEQIIKSADIIINTTPLGTWPKIDNCVDIPYYSLKKGTIAYDLVYNPEKTKFLTLCENNGAIIVNGMNMLKLQAEKAWLYYNNL